MAQEKQFENKIKRFLKKNNAWFIKYWAGAQFTKSGVPDILCCVNGYFVAIEVKAPNGRASELQKYNVRKINEAGGFAVVLYPQDFELFEQLIDFLNSRNMRSAVMLVRRINERSV